ncbi:MAG: acyl-CoA thioesterase [Gammaproteobacteria bacterium]|nr:MAG: acyl-CoA thioesterase [Gammaproteobacteria bacterium]
MTERRQMGLKRTAIDVPEWTDFVYPVHIESRHINDAGHMAFTTVPELLDRTRRAWFDHLGLDEQHLDGVGVIVADLQVIYCSEGHEGETLAVAMSVADVSQRSCQIIYRLTERSSGREVARARTALVFFDYTRKQPAHMPDCVRSKLECDGAI